MCYKLCNKMKRIVKVLSVLIIILSMTSCILSPKTSSNKEELSLSVLRNPRSFYYYTGSEITIEDDVYFVNKDGRRSNGVLYDYTYSNNIEPGTATAIITAKDDNELFYGSVTYTFTIVPNDQKIEVNTFSELKEALTNPKSRHIDIINDFDIPEGETLTISSDISVYVRLNSSGEYTKGATLKNYGTINVEEDAFFEVGGSSGYTSYFYNYGTIESSGKIMSLANGPIYNMGTINNSGEISVYSQLLSNSEITKVTCFSNGVYRVRTDINTEQLEYSKEIRYRENTELNKPSVHIEAYYIDSSNITYTNFDRIGTASASINMKDDDLYYYGSLSFTYTILKGETTVTSLDELIEKKSSGNYNEYNINPSTSLITIDSSFTTLEDEIYNFSKNVTISGNFTNNGTINMTGSTYNTLTINGTNTLTNNGTINLLEGSISSDNGTILNNLNGTINGHLRVNNLTNYGTVSLDKYSSYIRGSLNNYGTLSSESSINILNLRNNGSISFSNQLTILDNGLFYNDVNGTITLNKDSLFSGTSFENKGTIINKAKMSILDTSTVVLNSGTINNSEGFIYAFKDMNVSLNFILREYLTTSNVSLEFTDVTYDSLGHNPTVYIHGETIKSSDYITQSIKKKSDSSSVSGAPKDVGYYFKRVSVYGNYSKYAGSVDLEFHINYAAAHVTKDSEFKSNIDNKNYNLIILDTDITYNNSVSITIESYQTLDLNGHKLTLNSTIINRGTIISRKVSELNTLNSEEEISLIIEKFNSQYKALIDNYGTIINDGLIVVNNRTDKQSATLYSYSGSTIINNGVIYTQVDNLKLDESSTGIVYMREALDKSIKNVVLSYTETTYTGEEARPSVKVYNGEDELDINDYTVTYSNNINAGYGEVKVVPSSMFNELYYGPVTRMIKINKAIKLVSTVDDIVESPNYYKYKLVNNLALVTPLTIPEGMIFDLDIYDISGSKLIFSSNTSLEVSVDTIDRFNRFIYVANKITLVANIGTLNEDNNIRYFSGKDPNNNDYTTITTYSTEYLYNNAMVDNANYYYIKDKKIETFTSSYNRYSNTTSYYFKPINIGGYNVTKYEGIRLFDTIVDMNGYSILSNLKFTYTKEGWELNSKLDTSLSFINSSENESVIGSKNSANVGFDVYGTQDFSGYININFESVTVSGLKLFIPYMNGYLSVSGTNSKFIHSTSPALYVGGDNNAKTQINARFTTSFTLCTFKSEGDNGITIISGTNTFSGCTIESTGEYSTGTSSNVIYKGCGVSVIQYTNSSDRNIIVALNDSTVSSLNGYGIIFYKRKIGTGSSAVEATLYTSITYDNASQLTGALGKIVNY